MKINNLRNIAMGLTFLSFGIMYIGVFNRAILPYFFIVGCVILFFGMMIYFRLGAISIRIPQIECPTCSKVIKVLGKYDSCPKCKTRFVRDEEGYYQVK